MNLAMDLVEPYFTKTTFLVTILLFASYQPIANPRSRYSARHTGETDALRRLIVLPLNLTVHRAEELLHGGEALSRLLCKRHLRRA